MRPPLYLPPTHCLSLGKCHFTSPSSSSTTSSLLTPSSPRPRSLPFFGCQQLVVMEQTIVTHQFQEKEDGGLPAGSSANWRPNDVSFPSAVVLTQPGLGVTTTTLTTITQTGGDWSTGLFDVDGDQTTCVVGAVAPCCLDLSLAHQYGECLCLPLLPGSTIAMRVALRERYKIRGNICDDWTTVCCCYSLAVCQMVREMKRRTMTRTYHVSTALDCS